MNEFVPNWNMDEESRSLRDLLPESNQKKQIGSDTELIELLWQNGHVVLQSQIHNRKPPALLAPEFKQSADKHEQSILKSVVTFESSTSNLTDQDETAAEWFQCPLEDYSIDRDLYSEFFFDMPKNADHEDPENMWIKGGDAGEDQKRLESRDLGGAGTSSSLSSLSSSICLSSQFQVASKLNDAAEGCCASRSSKEEDHSTRLTSQEAAVASSSGGSGGCSFRGLTGQHNGNKRKERGIEEFESLSEDAENESVDDANNRAQRSTSTRRSRAAEVHNLSERRRRDRINEKMRALQELIPHCSKSDKASILDEAIEYLKSLQLQVQFLWMGTGMGPMMFRGFHQYMPRVGPVQMRGVPYMNNQFMASTSSANAANFYNQMPNVPLGAGLPGLDLNHFQPQSRAMNCDSYGPKTVQHQQHRSSAEPSSDALHVSGVSPSESTPKDKAG